jgi:hypothetical protein
MTQTEMIVAIAAIGLVALALLVRRSGPRITHIETRRDDAAPPSDKPE